MSKRKGDQIVTKSQLGPAVKRIAINLYEEKYVNFMLTGNGVSDGREAVTNAWTFRSAIAPGLTNSVGIGQGTNYNQRVGDKIRLKKIVFTIRIIPADGAVGGSHSDYCRVVVYRNKQANGAVVTQAQVFDPITGLNYASMHPRNLLLKDRITLTRDFTHQMVLVGGGSGSGPEMLMEVTITPKQVINYNGTSGVISEVLKNDYGIGFISSANDCCQIIINAQVVFTDA